MNIERQQVKQARIDPVDLAHINESVAFIRANNTRRVLAEMLPGRTAEERAAIGTHCKFTHAAVLVFPHTLTDLCDDLRASGLAVGEITPSVVVRDRLSRRYGLSWRSLEVGILRAPLQGRDGQPCALGQLLRTDADPSLHPLALLYGGSFYQSFGQLLRSVRTGRECFRYLFGQGHFDYFAERPELAELFDRAMASSVSMLGRITEIVDFSAARVAVDVAGGNGALLGQTLRATPHLRGVLLERPHAINRPNYAGQRRLRGPLPAHRGRLHQRCPPGRRRLPAVADPARLKRPAVSHDPETVR